MSYRSPHKLGSDDNPPEFVESEQLNSSVLLHFSKWYTLWGLQKFYDIFELLYDEIPLASTFITLNAWEQICIHGWVFSHTPNSHSKLSQIISKKCSNNLKQEEINSTLMQRKSDSKSAHAMWSCFFQK